MARMLITGGAGFIGSHLAEALLAREHEVTVIDDLSSGCRENIDHLGSYQLFRFVKDTITGESRLNSLVRNCDILFHLASVVGVNATVNEPVQTFRRNMTGVQHVLDAAHKNRKHVVIASSSEVYGKGTRIPFREDDDRLLGPLTKSRWSYAISKEAIECLAFGFHQQMGLPVTVVRLFNTVGPRQSVEHGMVLPRFVQQALRGQPLTVYGDGKQTRCFCDVEDVVRAVIDLAQCPSAIGVAVNVGSTDEMTVLDLAQRVLALAGRPLKSMPHRATPDDNAHHAGHPAAPIVFVPYEQAYGAGYEDAPRRVPDITRIRTMTGWEPRIPLDETIIRVIESLKNQVGNDSTKNMTQELDSSSRYC